MPEAVHEEFVQYYLNDPTYDECPWCGAKWITVGVPPRTHYTRTHEVECPFWLWLQADDDEFSTHLGIGYDFVPPWPSEAERTK